MSGRLKIVLQRFANRCGYQIRRVDAGVSTDDPFLESVRLARKDARCIVEVGAADGRDTERFCEALPGAEVIAFEPLPRSYQQLAARLSGLRQARTINAAVSDRSGSQDLHIGNWDDSSSLLVAQPVGASYDEYQKPISVIPVSVVTLDEVCAEQSVTNIDVLKMDAQGAELRILAGASGLLERRAIHIVYSEVHFTESYAGSGLFHDVARTLYSHAFRLHSLYRLVHDHQGRLLWGDAVFVNREYGAHK